MGMGSGPVTRGKMPAEMEMGLKMKAKAKGKKATASGKKGKAKKPASKTPWMTGGY